MAHALVALARSHNLFAGDHLVGGVCGAPVQLRDRADHVSRMMDAAGLSTGAARRSANRLHRLADADEALAQIVAAARTERARARSATRAVLHAAQADLMAAADTPVGRREAIARMVARLRIQHQYVLRTLLRARLLALRLRQLRYLRCRVAMESIHRDRALPFGSGTGRAAVLAAIRKALDIKGIHDPAARSRWERGMDAVARRESNYNASAQNNWDSNAAKGTPSKGAWQFIAPTFAAYHQPGTSSDVHNLVAQACAFINYAQGRYGVAADGSNLADRIQQADPRRAPRGY
ncbi:transglycosylase [Mycobacterium sp.]|uniref:transglycosylase SLT domain-containing protein n=1 Tax=Mycobacterium sp. TaxID=1785 RepID=UPI003BAD2EF4